MSQDAKFDHFCVLPTVNFGIMQTKYTGEVGGGRSLA